MGWFRFAVTALALADLWKGNEGERYKPNEDKNVKKLRVIASILIFHVPHEDRRVKGSLSGSGLMPTRVPYCCNN